MVTWKNIGIIQRLEERANIYISGHAEDVVEFIEQNANIQTFVTDANSLQEINNKAYVIMKLRAFSINRRDGL